MIKRRWHLMGMAAVATGATFFAACDRGEPAAPAEPVARGRQALERSATTERTRFLSWNVGGAAPVDAFRAKQIARKIQAAEDGFDVVLLGGVGDEELREELFRTLDADFPYSLYRASPFSDLMAFSRLAWQPTGGVDPPTFDEGAIELRDHGSKVDQWEPLVAFRKGTTLLHVGNGLRRYNVAFASFAPGAKAFEERANQLAAADEMLAARLVAHDLDETVLAGTLNYDGYLPNYAVPLGPSPSLERANATVLDSEYGTSVWGNLMGKPWFDAWRTTSPEDMGWTYNLGTGEGGNAPAFLGDFRYDYFLVDGSGYHDQQVPAGLDPGDWRNWSPVRASFSQHGGQSQCVNWVRRTLEGGPSDHVAVAMEMGPRNAHCNPALAEPVGSTVQLARELDRPGANHWYRVDQPGTYSIGLPPAELAAGLSFEIFDERSLSRGVRPAQNEGKEFALPACDHEPCVYGAERYDARNGPFYVRVFSPDGRTFGHYNLLVKRHDCSAPELACELSTNATLEPQIPTDRRYTGWFRYQTFRTFNPKRPQKLTLEVQKDSGFDGGIFVDVTRDGAAVGTQGPTTAAGFQFDESEEAVYLIQVTRTSFSTNYHVTARSNITILTGAMSDRARPKSALASPYRLGHVDMPMKLLCTDESGVDSVGDEEIAGDLYLDGRHVGGSPTCSHTFFDPGFDAGESLSLDDLLAEHGGYLGFTEKASLVLTELAGEDCEAATDGDGDTGTFDFLPVAADLTSPVLGVQAFVSLYPAPGAQFQLQYAIGNTP